jgi:agmatinase
MSRDRARFVLIGAPYDGSATLGWPGSRYGPDEVRRALGGVTRRVENGEIYSLDDDRIVPWDPAWLADAGDAPVVPSDEAKTRAAVRDAVAERLRQGEVPVLVGGDDSISFPFLQAVHDAASSPIGLIHLDAHLDLMDGSDAQGRYSHSSGIRRSLELPRLAGRHVIQIGTRNFNFPASKRFLDSAGVTELPAREFTRLGAAAAAERALATVAGASRVALVIDIDVLDPAFAPGCGAFEPGGLTSRELLDFVQIVAPHAGALALTEVNPLVDFRNVTAKVAAGVLFHFMAVHARHHLTDASSRALRGAQTAPP